jgi:hypothetical protein
MNMVLKTALGALLAAAMVMAVVDGAGAGGAKFADADSCLLYGFAPYSRAFAVCRMNVRHYWTSGPCGDNFFAAAHPRYCHLYPPLDF